MFIGMKQQQIQSVTLSYHFKFRSVRTAYQFIKLRPTFGNRLFLCQFLRNLFHS